MHISKCYTVSKADASRNSSEQVHEGQTTSVAPTESRVQAAPRDSVATGEGSHMQNKVKTLDDGNVREEDIEEESEDEQVDATTSESAELLNEEDPAMLLVEGMAADVDGYDEGDCGYMESDYEDCNWDDKQGEPGKGATQ